MDKVKDRLMTVLLCYNFLQKKKNKNLFLFSSIIYLTFISRFDKEPPFFRSSAFFYSKGCRLTRQPLLLICGHLIDFISKSNKIISCTRISSILIYIYCVVACSWRCKHYQFSITWSRVWWHRCAWIRKT